MPKAIVRANARALPKAKSRRGKARAAVSIAKKRRSTPARKSSAGKPAAKSPATLLREAVAFAATYPTLQAVGAHRSAHERFERAVTVTDDMAAKREGSIVSDANEAEWDEAGAAEARALRRLVRTRPTTVEGLRALIGYTVSCFRDQGWDESTMLQLLTSIMESVPLRLGRRAA